MNRNTMMIQYGVVKNGGGGAWRTAVPGGQPGPGRARSGPLPVPVVHAAAAAAVGRVERRRRSAMTAEQRCCVPSGCSRYAGELIDPQDPGDAVKVVCSNSSCVVGSWMHADCYEEWLQRVLFYIRCCELGRSLLNDRQMSLQLQGGCSLGGYEPVYRACACVCRKGVLRRDLRYTSPVNQSLMVCDVTPVAAALLYYPNVQQQQQQRMRTCSFSSTGSGSTGSAATPPLSPPRPGAFFPQSAAAAKPPSSKPEPPGTGSSGSSTGNTPSPPPVTAAQKSSAVPLPARGNIFEHRADLTAFKAIRRAAQNAYHIRLDDDGPHGNDDVRRLLMRRLSAAGVRRFACVACRRSLPVYDEFPLVDGTLFLSPKHYGTSGCGEGSVECREENTSNSLSAASPGVSTAHQASHVAVPVVYNRRMLYLHAVCLACLGALPDDDRRRGRSSTDDCSQTERGCNKIACRFCGSSWKTGECLVLGTMYTYDVLACTPCCTARGACRRCGGPPVVVGSRGLKPDSATAPASFSDCSRLGKCSWCGLEDYHYVKPFDEVFTCSQRSK